MVTKKEKVQFKAVEILRKRKRGVKYARLGRIIQKIFPEIQEGTIFAYVQQLDQVMPNEVYRPARGVFRHTSFREKDTKLEEIGKSKMGIEEEKFYKKFADYLVGDLQECTRAIPLGGKIFKDKWGTPDVIGIERSKPTDVIKHEDVLISAEIKTDASPTALITAFGQTCAYKAFSHKAYIVIPKSASEEDTSRIESLCLIFGIGLILFDSDNPEDPKFSIKTRPVKTEPDMFYLNQYAAELVDSGLFG